MTSSTLLLSCLPVRCCHSLGYFKQLNVLFCVFDFARWLWCVAYRTGAFMEYCQADFVEKKKKFNIYSRAATRIFFIVHVLTSLNILIAVSITSSFVYLLFINLSCAIWRQQVFVIRWPRICLACERPPCKKLQVRTRYYVIVIIITCPSTYARSRVRHVRICTLFCRYKPQPTA